MIKYSLDFFGTTLELVPIEEKSEYNNVYFEIKVPDCGDNYGLNTHKNNILYEECHEDWDYYEYHIGHFEGDKFVPVLSWDNSYEDLVRSDLT